LFEDSPDCNKKEKDVFPVEALNFTRFETCLPVLCDQSRKERYKFRPQTVEK